MTLVIRSLTALLLGGLLQMSAAEEWPSSKALEEAESLLFQARGKARKQQALAWLERFEEFAPDLGRQPFLEPLVLYAAGHTADADHALLPLLQEQGGLNHQAARFSAPLTQWLPGAIRRAMRSGDYDALPALVRTLIDRGNLPPADALAPVGRRLARNQDPAARAARAALARVIQEHPSFEPEDGDRLLARLYGARDGAPPPESRPAPDHEPSAPALIKHPHFLVMGGGGSHRNNQISLEKNVEFLLRLQDKLGLPRDRNHVLFADGEDEGRDLQMVDPQRELPELNQSLAAILGSPGGIELSYRSHHIQPVDGPCTEPNVRRFFEGLEPGADQQLIINFTGHGGRGEREDALNTSLFLWENRSLRMKDFCAMLDKVPEDIPVTLVMVQCYSGGFANVLFKEGDPKKGLSNHPRCGFFSTVHDRVAAGCTPDINEEDYQEYSSYFLAALSGATRTGTALPAPDYNGDGQVGLAEAHAYSLIASTTIDVSVKTSDAFLRHFSRLRPESGGADGGFIDDSSYARLLRHAGACEVAVLEALSATLGLGGDARLAAARSLVGEVEKEQQGIDARRRDVRRELGEMRGDLKRLLDARWPELGNPWHPEVARLLAESAGPIMEAIRTHAKYPDFESRQHQLEELDGQHLELERRRARLQRYLRTAENVALEANLPRVASDDLQDRYRQLLALEHAAFKPSPNHIAHTSE